MENYIVINGEKIQLTKEQLNQLGFGVQIKRNNPFNSTVKNCVPYYANVGREIETYVSIDGVLKGQGQTHRDNLEDIENANCFNDKRFAEQVLLHEILNRKLLKYACDNKAEDCKWVGQNEHYYICFDTEDCRFYIGADTCVRNQQVYFSKRKIAERAVKDVIEPFMKEHFEFVW